jgi:hypothetical protein
MSLSKTAASYSVSCNLCNKSFKSKSKWYTDHVDKCSHALANNLLSTNICSLCGKVYKHQSSWYLKHIEKCKSICNQRDSFRNISPGDNIHSNLDHGKVFNFSKKNSSIKLILI